MYRDLLAQHVQDRAPQEQAEAAAGDRMVELLARVRDEGPTSLPACDGTDTAQVRASLRRRLHRGASRHQTAP